MSGEARARGGRADGLLHLLTEYARGAVILAGTGVPPHDPVPTGPRVSLDCEDCPTTLFGATDAEAADRLAAHREQSHGATHD